jgi:hypothetical protein
VLLVPLELLPSDPELLPLEIPLVPEVPLEPELPLELSPLDPELPLEL